MVVCAGQEPRRDLHDKLKAAIASATSAASTSSTPTAGTSTGGGSASGVAAKARPPPRLFLIGGALEAGELDAKRAIDQGTR